MPRPSKLADFLIAIVVAMASLASPAIATSKEDLQVCLLRMGSADVVMAACTRGTATGDAKSRASFFDIRAGIFDDKHDYARAIADFDQAIRLDPTEPLYHRNRGDLWRSKGEHERAIADFSEAIRLAPEGAPFYEDRCGSGTK
jgi:tetratricopeptide (TPR) repeat protein